MNHKARSPEPQGIDFRPELYQGVPWRLVYRLPWLLVHLLLSLPLAVIAQMKLLRDQYWGRYTLEDHIGRWWCRGLLKIFGLRIRCYGELNHDAVLLVANHISWLDIIALLSLRMVRFVAKDEIRRWPVIGWLVTRARTVYVARGCSDSAQQVMSTMQERLREGQTIAIFPEGGIPEVPTVARFRHRLFDAAVATGNDVEPVVLRYHIAGRMDKSPGFWPDEHFLANFFRLLGGPPGVVEVFILPRISSQNHTSRELAALAETQVRSVYLDDYELTQRVGTAASSKLTGME